MADSYLITIRFAADNSTVKQTEKKLNSVFDRVVKRFKNGFKKVWNGLKLGAGITMAATAVTTLLGKFGQINDQVNDLLQKADAVRTRANNTGSSVQEYGFVQAYAGAKNISAEQFATYLSRIQLLLGQAEEGEDNVLSNYKGEKNAVKVFYNLMETLSKMDTNVRANMANEIFGKGAAVGLGDLLSEGFGDTNLLKTLQAQDWQRYAQNVARDKKLAGEQSLLAALRDMADFNTKSEMTSRETIQKQDAFLRNQNANDNAMYGQYDKLADLQATAQKMEKVITDFTLTALPLLQIALTGLTEIKEVLKDMKTDPKSHLAVIAQHLKYLNPANVGVSAANTLKRMIK